jgi:hypothetical protein
LIKAGFANKVTKMEANIRQLEAKTASLDEALLAALVQKERIKLPVTIADSNEGDLMAIKAECKVFRDATDEEKKTYLPNVRLPAYPERLLVPAGEEDKWQCPILKTRDPMTNRDVFYFDPEYVELWRRSKGRKIYPMARWVQTDGRTVPFHVLAAGVNPLDGKTQHPAISGAIIAPKLFVRIGFKLGENRKQFGLKYNFSESEGDNFWLRGWQPMPRQQQIMDDSISSSSNSSSSEPKKKFKGFSKPLPGTAPPDAVLWNRKDKSQQQSDSSSSSSSSSSSEPWDYNKGAPMETKSSPIAMNEDSRFNDSREYGAAIKVQKEQESAEAAFAAIASQAAQIEPDETTMMEPPATVALKGKGKRPLAEEQEAVNSQGAAKRANKGKGK